MNKSLKESKRPNKPEDLIDILADNIQITTEKESDKLTEFEDKASKLLRKHGLRYVDTSRLYGSTYDIRFVHPRKEYVLTVEFDTHTGEITNGGVEEAEYMDEDEWEEIIEIFDESFKESLNKSGVNKMQNKKTRDPLNEGFNKLFKNILNESSIRDDIDADAGDKKEYAKKVFMKKKDDADSDKDYKLRRANLKEPRELKESDKPAALSIKDAQKWIDYDMKKYGKISERTNKLIKKAGFQIIKDDHGDYEVTAGKFEEIKRLGRKK